MVKTTYEVWAYVSNGPDDGGEWDEQSSFSTKLAAFKEAAKLEVRGLHVSIAKVYESTVGQATSRAVTELYDSGRADDYRFMDHVKVDLSFVGHDEYCEACKMAAKSSRETKNLLADIEKKGF